MKVEIGNSTVRKCKFLTLGFLCRVCVAWPGSTVEPSTTVDSLLVPPSLRSPSPVSSAPGDGPTSRPRRLMDGHVWFLLWRRSFFLIGDNRVWSEVSAVTGNAAVGHKTIITTSVIYKVTSMGNFLPSRLHVGNSFHCWKHWTHLVIVKYQYYNLCNQKYTLNNKPVKILAQLVIEFAREWWNLKNHPRGTTLCAFRCIIKGFSWSILLLEWGTLSFSQCFILSTALQFSLPSKCLC